ncbi:MAG: hypothetical protein ABJC26_07045 [Gemmatimonadaceae bacterium]
MVTIVTALISAAFFASVALLFAITVRRGPLLRAFQLDVVNRNGEPAGRLRIALRIVITWLPMILPVAVVVMFSEVSIFVATVMAVVAFVVVPLIWVYGIVSAIRTPERGLADRLAGTWLVPE